ncbi:HAD-IIB family hydrolase [Vibrio maerlii]|uniref:HAD-IIB family hydrolase n=1 Tax=Vibrio maerlii TaxID=2231648 RepID=UPI000E3C54C2|nr:HAD-IIB family hydrolase [Vibrio maerlii]
MIKMLVCDFDGTISGGSSSGIDKLNHYVTRQSPLNFIVATGRTLSSIRDGLSGDNFPTPISIVSDVGTRIHHAENNQSDSHWSKHVERNWQPEQVQEAIRSLPFLGKQSNQHQSRYKITIEGQLDFAEYQELKAVLETAKIKVDLTYSHNWFLDITPKGVCKASAIRFLMNKHNIKAEEVCVAGDSANDSTMLTMEGINGILVANHYPEVAHLSDSKSIYTSKATHAEGVLEGLIHWQQLRA